MVSTKQATAGTKRRRMAMRMFQSPLKFGFALVSITVAIYRFSCSISF